MSLIALLVLTLSAEAFATHGFDAAVAMSTNTFTCFYNLSHRIFIGRVWRSIGKPDLIGIQNIKDARAAGFNTTDGYIFPDLRPNRIPAVEQVQAAIRTVQQKGAQLDRLWLDVEISAWPNNKTFNRQFILDMANKVKSMGIEVGIYTNYNNWQQIVGLDWTEMSQYPLWYAHYDGVPNYNDFNAFAGWNKPAMKQYQGDVQGPCDVNNLDWNWSE